MLWLSGLRFSTRLLLLWSMVMSTSIIWPMTSRVSAPRKIIAMLYFASRPFSMSKYSLPLAPSDFRFPRVILNRLKPASPLGDGNLALACWVDVRLKCDANMGGDS